MLTRLLIVAVLVASGAARPYAQAPDLMPSLTDSSAVIASGTVVALSSAADGVAIYTYVTLQITEVLKGAVSPGQSIVLKQIGGVANGVGLHIDGQARFAVGDDVVVFLAVRPRDRTLYTVGLDIGVRPLSDVPDVRAVMSARPQADPAAGVPFVTRPPEMATGDVSIGTANFTFLEDGPARWHQADEGVAIPVDFATPLGSLPADPVATLDAATAAWNAVGTTLSLYRNASGSHTCPARGFSGSGRIAFYWDDPCGEIGDGDALTFGVGGGYFTDGSLRTINGVVFAQFLQGIAILNNTGPHRTTTAACLQDAATHVLGHAVGLGHSGDSTAVMYQTLRADCSGGTSGLGTDDLAGLRAIYPAVPGGGAPPHAPTALTASIMGTTVNLNWTPATTGGVVLTYVVEAGSASGLANLAVLTVQGATPGVTVTAVPPGTYFVRVRARNALGTSAASPETIVTMEPCVLPAAPTGLKYSAVDNIVSLDWKAPTSNTPLQGYVLSAGFGPGLANALVTSLGPTPSFSGFAPAGNYYVRVQAVNACGAGPASEDLLVTVQACAAPPSAPTNLRFTKNGNVVTLDWNAPASGAPTQYRLVVGSVAGGGDILISNTGNNNTSLVATAPNGTYFVRVQAVNLCGESLSSNEVIVAVP